MSTLSGHHSAILWPGIFTILYLPIDPECEEPEGNCTSEAGVALARRTRGGSSVAALWLRRPVFCPP